MQKLLLGLCSLLTATAANAQTFFGGTDIDYWKEGPRPMARPLLPQPAQKKPEEKPGAGAREQEKVAIATSLIRASDSKPFSWSDYSDPKSITFWDDGGEWVPPRPFREVAANPTADNVQNYIAWLSKKGEVAAKVQTAVNDRTGAAQPIAQKAPASSPVLSAYTSGSAPAKAASEVDMRKVDIVYFYQSTCPHCRRSAQVIEDLKRMGARVIPVQLDYQTEPPLHKGSVPYSDRLKAEHPVSATPTWILSYRNQTFQREGSLTIPDIYEIIDIGS
jgi:thiol-disulfide isomerase/thioredoxin